MPSTARPARYEPMQSRPVKRMYRVVANLVVLSHAAFVAFVMAGGQIVAVWPSNATFGGKENRTLFVTARTSVYAVEMQAQGHVFPGRGE